MPDISLRLIGDGGEVGLKEVSPSFFHGEVMVIDVWATWCPPCRTVLPLVEQEIARAGIDVSLVSVCTDGYDEPAKARELVRELSPKTLLLADDGSFTEALRVKSIPHVIVVDREGKIVGQQPYAGTEALRSFLATTLPTLK